VRDPRISARHASIIFLGGGRYEITDLNSANGVIVNGVRIAQAVITEDDRVSLGRVDFSLSAYREQLAQEMAAIDAWIIGRDPTSCQLVVNDSRVSARHARVEARGAALFIRDLGSANGIFVNGQRVSSGAVYPGDAISLGTVSVDLFELVGRASRTTPQFSRIPRSRSGAVGAAPPPQPPAQVAPVTPPVTQPHKNKASNSKARYVVVGSVVLAVCLVGAALLYYYNQQLPVTKSYACKVCSSVYDTSVETYARHEGRHDYTSRDEYCQDCGDEPVEVQTLYKCSVCGKVIRREVAAFARREERTNQTHAGGYCSDYCRLHEAGREILDSGVGDLLLKGLF